MYLGGLALISKAKGCKYQNKRLRGSSKSRKSKIRRLKRSGLESKSESCRLQD